MYVSVSVVGHIMSQSESNLKRIRDPNYVPLRRFWRPDPPFPELGSSTHITKPAYGFAAKRHTLRRKTAKQLLDEELAVRPLPKIHIPPTEVAQSNRTFPEFGNSALLTAPKYTFGEEVYCKTRASPRAAWLNAKDTPGVGLYNLDKPELDESEAA